MLTAIDRCAGLSGVPSKNSQNIQITPGLMYQHKKYKRKIQF